LTHRQGRPIRSPVFRQVSPTSPVYENKQANGSDVPRVPERTTG
jgi:hypothetical protein